MNNNLKCKVCGAIECDVHQDSLAVSLDFVRCPKCKGQRFWETCYDHADTDYNCQSCGHRTIFDGLEQVK